MTTTYILYADEAPIHLEVGSSVNYTCWDTLTQRKLYNRLCLGVAPHNVGVLIRQPGTTPESAQYVQSVVFLFDLSTLDYKKGEETLVSKTRGAELLAGLMATYAVVFKESMRFPTTGWTVTRLK